MRLKRKIRRFKERRSLQKKTDLEDASGGSLYELGNLLS